jgi:hypothetical protein
MKTWHWILIALALVWIAYKIKTISDGSKSVKFLSWLYNLIT